MNPLRVLVVDDEPSILTFVERVLTDAGYDVTMASDGLEALRTIAASPTPFDLFVVDLLMPRMHGDELAQHLREKKADAKILYLTGFSDRLFGERDALSENEAFVDKPVTVKGLREAVSMMLSRNI